jgi:hypothetical protein
MKRYLQADSPSVYRPHLHSPPRVATTVPLASLAGMSKRSRREKARRAQAHRQRPARSGRRTVRHGPTGRHDAPDLMHDVADALESGSPLPLLGLASSMLAM